MSYRKVRPLRSTSPLALSVLLVLALGLVASTPATADAARKRTSHVSGWSAGQVTATRGSVVRLPVAVRPATKGRRVTLQRRAAGSSRWHVVDRTRTHRLGRATLAFRAGRGGHLRLVVAGTRRARSLVTSSRRLHVPSAVSTPLSEQEAEVLRLTNEARGVARTCGDTEYAAVAAVRSEGRLVSAARGHAARMGRENFFSHTAPDGSNPGDRIRAAGYDARGWGENIAAGYATPEAVVQGWLSSPGHCSNLMGASWTELGVGYASRAGSRYGTYWVQNFGSGTR